MDAKLTITIQPSGGKDSSLTVKDAMGQILDWVSLIETKPTTPNSEERVKWVLKSVSTNSPLIVEMAAEGNPEHAKIWAERATQDINDTNNAIKTIIETGNIPKNTSAKNLDLIKGIMRRNVNGIGLTKVQNGAGEALLLTAAKSKTALDVLEKFTTPSIAIGKHRSRGDIIGHLVRAGEFYGKSAFWVKDKSGNEFPCIMTSALAETIGVETRLIDIWRNRRVLVSGIKYYDTTGKFLRMEVSKEPEPVEKNPVNLDKILDQSFTGTATSAEYLSSIRGENA